MRMGTIINRIINPLGFQLNRIVPSAGPPPVVAKILYKLTVEELHDCLVQFKFTDLPETPGRLDALLNLQGTTISEAMWILNGLHKSLSLEGDVCEFGIAHGATSALLANEIRNTDKNLWLFDSFEGLPAPTEKDKLIDDIEGLGSMEAYEGVYSYDQNWVLGKLKAINFPRIRTKIVPGFIEQSIKTATLPEKVCFAYIDFDFYEPILVGLDYLAEALTPGGCVVVDDYGYFSDGAQAAVDEFVASHKDTFTLEIPPKWARHFAVLRKNA
ncbi:MAG: TylF/MycF/NovP-related O-methyltransferase [Aggregatilineales bacterium]